MLCSINFVKGNDKLIPNRPTAPAAQLKHKPETQLATIDATVTVVDLKLLPPNKWLARLNMADLLQWRQAQGPCRGLYNQGNTCFMNSVLQCLASTAGFVQALETTPHRATCPTPSSEGCVYCQAEGTLLNMWNRERRAQPMAPRWLAQNIKMLGRQFRVGRQEDSHEFLRCLLERMGGVVIKQAGVKEGSPDRRDETTLIHNVFGGYLRNQLHCTSCGFDSNNYDSFLDLSLEVGNGINTVHKALSHFSAPEVLDEKNQWKCARCSKHVRARKQMTIRLPPAVLTIHLKRFSFTPRGANMFGGGARFMDARFLMYGLGGNQKLTEHIAFPVELDVAQALSDSAVAEGQPSKYSLHGVLVHHGHTANSGHYYAFTQAPNGLWHCMDDDTVSISGWPVVSKQQAYMLFYTRVPGQAAPRPSPSLRGLEANGSAAKPAAISSPVATAKGVKPVANGMPEFALDSLADHVWNPKPVPNANGAFSFGPTAPLPLSDNPAATLKAAMRASTAAVGSGGLLRAPTSSATSNNGDAHHATASTGSASSPDASGSISPALSTHSATAKGKTAIAGLQVVSPRLHDTGSVPNRPRTLAPAEEATAKRMARRLKQLRQWRQVSAGGSGPREAWAWDAHAARVAYCQQHGLSPPEVQLLTPQQIAAFTPPAPVLEESSDDASTEEASASDGVEGVEGGSDKADATSEEEGEANDSESGDDDDYDEAYNRLLRGAPMTNGNGSDEGEDDEDDSDYTASASDQERAPGTAAGTAAASATGDDFSEDSRFPVGGDGRAGTAAGNAVFAHSKAGSNLPSTTAASSKPDRPLNGFNPSFTRDRVLVTDQRPIAAASFDPKALAASADAAASFSWADGGIWDSFDNPQAATSASSVGPAATEAAGAKRTRDALDAYLDSRGNERAEWDARLDIGRTKKVKDRHAEEPHPSGTTAGNVYQAALDARREAQSALVDSQGSHGYRKGFESRKHAGHGYHTKKHNRKQLRGKR